MKSKPQTEKISISLHYLCPIMLFLIIFSLMAFWLSHSTQPLIDEPFRQSQTAISALWFNLENPIRGLLNYETPELGPPWQIPMEFPLYQAVVAYICRITGYSLTFCGRMVSGVFFILTLIPFYSICNGLGFGKRFFYCSSVLLLGSPIYIFYSRMFLIESTAVFFGFVFLALLVKALDRGNGILWLLAGFAAILCGLVKVTTFPSFGIAAIGIVLLKYPVKFPFNWNEFKNTTFPSLAKLAVLGALAVGIVAVWTFRSDAIKLSGELSNLLTSNKLSAWSYGSIEQKLDWRLWRDLLWTRVVKLVFGWPVVFGFFLGISTLLRGKQIFIFFWLLGLFIVPMLIFTNLHHVHPHYQTANAFWLIFALGFSLASWSHKVAWKTFAFALFLIFSSQLYSFYKNDYIRMTLYHDDSVSAGLYIRDNAPLKSSILVFGDDWSPEVGFYSERKAYYIPAWCPENTAEQIFNRVGNVQSEWPIQAIVHRTSGFWAESYSESLNQKFLQMLSRLPEQFTKTKIGEYNIYLLQSGRHTQN